MSSNHEIVAKGRTFQGSTVLLFEDGLVTFAMGKGIKGVGASRSKWARARDLEAGRAALAEISLYDDVEVSEAIKAARNLYRSWSWAAYPNGPLPGHVRSAMASAVGAPILDS